jgi:hypothetical protein
MKIINNLSECGKGHRATGGESLYSFGAFITFAFFIGNII